MRPPGLLVLDNGRWMTIERYHTSNSRIQVPCISRSIPFRLKKQGSNDARDGDDVFPETRCCDQMGGRCGRGSEKRVSASADDCGGKEIYTPASIITDPASLALAAPGSAGVARASLAPPFSTHRQATAKTIVSNRATRTRAALLWTFAGQCVLYSLLPVISYLLYSQDPLKTDASGSEPCRVMSASRPLERGPRIDAQSGKG